MAWDRNRPVPWKRVLKPFAIYAVVAAVLLVVVSRSFDPGMLVGLVAGGIIYAGVVAVLIKFGWNPPIFQTKEERAATAAAAAERRAARKGGSSSSAGRKGATTTPGTRPPPAPTRRTNATNHKAKVPPRR